MFKKLIGLICSITLLVTAFSEASIGADNTKECVIIINKGTHFEVSLNFTGGKSHYEVGKELGEEIHKVVPNYEKLLDSLINDEIKILLGTKLSKLGYQILLYRLKDIKPQLDKEYRDEIDGIASTCTGGKNDILGDNKLSADELYIINLFPDIYRVTQCFGIAAFGQQSATKTTVAGRNLGWCDGLTNQLKQLHAVTTFQNGSKSICTSGFLGFMGVISGVSRNKVFAAILDSNSGGNYDSKMRRSYPFDLRHALENCNTLDKVADYMKSPKRKYAFSHLIFMADSKTSKVLENNISETGPRLRAVRTDVSPLNNGVTWGIKNCICAVNSFILRGNLDNHTKDDFNYLRWDQTKQLLNSYKKPIDTNKVKEILGSPTLYAKGTMQLIVIEPATLKMQIFFTPKSGELSPNPKFENIPINFK